MSFGLSGFRSSIQSKITILLVVLLVMAVIFNIAWSNDVQLRQAEQEMLEKTRILNQEMRAVWEFIDINQSRIDTDADGNYNFKNIYCAIAGKSVASLFMRDNDYVIRYVNLQPRRITSLPDDFEQSALLAFRSGIEDAGDKNAANTPEATSTAVPNTPEIPSTATPSTSDTSSTKSAATAISLTTDESYGVTVYEGRRVFRYVSPIFIKESCLECHGSPQGEIDVTGYPKEGMSVGDLAGAISIVMPIDLYMEGIQANIIRQSVYFSLVWVLLIAIACCAIFYLVQRLQKANERLREESRYKSDFLAIMSHELRTPLTSILAFAEIWERSLVANDDEGRQAAKEVKENGFILLEMVNNILEAARLDAGHNELHREWVDMVDLLGTVEGIIRPLAERKNINFTTEVMSDTPLIYADWEKLRRIVENLASNAVKFTHPGGSVRIAASRNTDIPEDAQAEILIKVSDTGIGIHEQDIQRLFRKFMQLDQSARRRYRGSGLGLAVVKDLTDAHGGSVEVYSVHKQGSVFTVHIPQGGSLEDTAG